MPGSVKFPTSCYSVSWKMLTEVDYWDEEVIPEDWHVYLKCCFTLGDRVHVEALFLPLGNDCVLTDGYFKTLKAHYAQSVRHAWGASDIPYAWRAAAQPRFAAQPQAPVPALAARSPRCTPSGWRSGTSSRSASSCPSKLTGSFGAPMPHWWTHRYPRPWPGLAPGEHHPPVGLARTSARPASSSSRCG